MRAFNAIMPPAADTAVVEVEEIVDAGSLDPEMVVTQGIFIDRIVSVPRRED
jgi:3-oxoadipate CoA-transferase alpha subunit